MGATENHEPTPGDRNSAVIDLLTREREDMLAVTEWLAHYGNDLPVARYTTAFMPDIGIVRCVRFDAHTRAEFQSVGLAGHGRAPGLQVALRADPVRHRGGVMTAPTVTYEPDELAGEWVFKLHAVGRTQRLRTTELTALYRACDTALNQHRKAVMP